MRILVINWQDIRNPLGGGAEVHLHQVFSRLVRRGHSVTLLCCRFPGAPSTEVIDGITVVRRGGRAWFNGAVPFAYGLGLRPQGFDVVVDDLNKIPFFTPLFVREPLVAIAHHLFDRSIFLETNIVAASYVYWTERLALALYRQRGVPFMVVSESTRAEFQRRGYARENLPIVHNCVDHALYRATGRARSAAPLIGYFGRLKRYKSVDHLLRAAALVRKEIPGLKCVIVGEGDDRPRLEGVAAGLGLDDVVTFTGYVSEERKVDLLQEMWVMVTTSSKEGWGLTVLEANACGTPVIASDVPGLRDAVRDGETGILYPYGDVDRLAAAMRTVLNDDGLRGRLRERALAWAKTFDWDLAAEKAEAVLEQRIRDVRTAAPRQA